MTLLKSKGAKIAARIGPRAMYGQSIYNCLSDGMDLTIVSADLGRSSGLDRVSKEFPARFINCGITEQAMVAFSAGLAREGNSVFASSFAPFLTLRASEHVRVNMGYMEEPVVLVGLGSGVSMTFLGNTHFGLEDLSTMSAIPNMTVVSPADAGSIPNFIKQLAGMKKPAYLRLTGVPGAEPVYDNCDALQIGRLSTVLEAGSSVAIIGIGSIVSQALTAATYLVESGIGVSVFDCHTLKPLDEISIKAILQTYELVITVEEHFVRGGLYAAVADLLAREESDCKLVGYGVRDEWVNPGSYEFMLKNLELDSSSLFKNISELIKNMERRTND